MLARGDREGLVILRGKKATEAGIRIEKPVGKEFCCLTNREWRVQQSLRRQATPPGGAVTWQAAAIRVLHADWWARGGRARALARPLQADSAGPARRNAWYLDSAVVVPGVDIP